MSESWEWKNLEITKLKFYAVTGKIVFIICYFAIKC